MSSRLARQCLACAATAIALAAQAEAPWPSRTVTLVVAAAPGGPSDQLARRLQEPLAQKLGQPVAIENRPGASGSIGAAMVAKAAPDGYTWLLSPDTHAVNPSLNPTLPFDTLKDLHQVMLVGSSPLLITAHPATPYKSFADVIAIAKADPDRISYATIGSGSLGHLAMSHIQSTTGTRMTHVPAKGPLPLVQDAVDARVPIAIGSAALLSPSVKNGQLRAIGVSSTRRLPILPEARTLSEQGVSAPEMAAWWGLHAPAGTPQSVVARMHRALSAALRAPAVQDTLAAQGVLVRASSPEEFDRFLASEVRRWRKVVEQHRITP